MIYIDTNQELTPLIEIWTRNNTNIEIGNNIQEVRNRILRRIPILLINPWYHIEKDSNARPTRESLEAICDIQKALKNNLCAIFGGLGEVEYFGNMVQTDFLTMKSFKTSLNKLQSGENQRVPTTYEHTRSYSPLPHHSDLPFGNLVQVDSSGVQREVEQYPFMASK